MLGAPAEVEITVGQRCAGSPFNLPKVNVGDHQDVRVVKLDPLLDYSIPKLMLDVVKMRVAELDPLLNRPILIS